MKKIFYHHPISHIYLSFITQSVIGIGKFILGIFYGSYWFMISASYYLILSITRGHILYQNNGIDNDEQTDSKLKKQFMIYYRSGFFIILLGISYMIICIWMFFLHEEISYPHYILYGIAAIAFYKIGMGFYGLLTVKKHQNPVYSMIEIIYFLDACVSIVAIQCALLTSQNSIFASSSSALLGIVVSLIFIITGIICINKAKKKRILQL